MNEELNEPDLLIRNLRVQQEVAKLEILRLRKSYAQQALMPSHMYPVQIYRDGSHWVCILHTHPEMMNCPIAYGNSPAQAMINFDAIWLGIGTVIQPPDEDEEEPL